MSENKKSQSIVIIETLGGLLPPGYESYVTALVEQAKTSEKLGKAQFALECYSEHLTTKEFFATIVDRKIEEV